MKWPEHLTMIRHDESAYNRLQVDLREDPLYKNFERIFDLKFDSEDTFKLARELKEKYGSIMADHNTPLAENAGWQAERMAGELKQIIGLPNVIFVSPYERTHRTLDLMKKGWPELTDVKTYEEERIREQEHGLVALYRNWRIFFAFHPEQKELYELQGHYWYRYPQGENVADVRDRNRSWVTTLTRDFSEREVMAVTHHLNILAVRANFERWDADRFQEVNDNDRPINCGITIYMGDPAQGQNGKFILQMYNKQLY